MKNIFKKVDLDQVKDQLFDIKDQVQDIKFRKPWTKGSATPPLVFMAIGAAVAVAGYALFRNRKKVAQVCSNCGAELMDRLESSGIKDKAEKIMGKMKNGSDAKSPSSMENYQPV